MTKDELIKQNRELKTQIRNLANNEIIMDKHIEAQDEKLVELSDAIDRYDFEIDEWIDTNKNKKRKIDTLIQTISILIEES